MMRSDPCQLFCLSVCLLWPFLPLNTLFGCDFPGGVVWHIFNHVVTLLHLREQQFGALDNKVLKLFFISCIASLAKYIFQ